MEEEEGEGGEGGEGGVMAAGGGGAVSNARRRRRRGGSENLLGAKIDGVAQPHHRNNFDFDFGANNNQPLSLKASKRRPAERAASDEKGKDDADGAAGNERGGGLRQQ